MAIRIRKKPGVVTLDMEKYIGECVKEAFPGGVHHTYNTPAVQELPKMVAKAAEVKDTTYVKDAVGKRFRRLTMQMLYVASHTRPDIALAVGLLTRVQAWPTPELLKQAERVLIYLSGTIDMKLTYTRCTKDTIDLNLAPRVVIEGASDATFDAAHSTSGYLIFLMNAAIAWCMKKQVSVALSTYQAEVMAGSLAACEFVSVRGLLNEMGFPQTSPSTLKMDSTSAINLAEDPVMHSQSKHIARRDLFIRELKERGILSPVYVKTDKNTADALTKPLMKEPFYSHRATMLGLDR